MTKLNEGDKITVNGKLVEVFEIWHEDGMIHLIDDNFNTVYTSINSLNLEG